MKTFIYHSVVAIVFLTLTSVQSRGQESIEATYLVFNSDQQIETDEIEVVQGERYSDDIRSVGANQERRVARLQYENGTLESYEQTINGFPSARASNDLKFLKLYEKEALVGMFPVEETILFLDPNMYSQYSFIIHVFEKMKKDKARLNVCVPQMQDFVYVDIERHGTDVITVGAKTITASHVRLAIAKKEVVNCWLDGERIIGMYLATKNLFVADAGYEKLYESLKRIINRAM
ncbi:MAG: hypothetical protein EPO24_13255 [Bacteroidetes bacterium]|nr:MAG: hypothetical protein EPO24_13255 [Bacteroidota bacterium]